MGSGLSVVKLTFVVPCLANSLKYDAVVKPLHYCNDSKIKFLKVVYRKDLDKNLIIP